MLRLQARGESQPTPEGPRLSVHCKTSRERFSGNLALIISTKAQTDLSLAHVPHAFARAKKRS